MSQVEVGHCAWLQYIAIYLLDSLCSHRVQLQACGAQLSVHLLHVIVMGGRELPDPSVLLH